MTDAEKTAFIKEQAAELWKLAHAALDNFQDRNSYCVPQSLHDFVEMGLYRIEQLADKL